MDFRINSDFFQHYKTRILKKRLGAQGVLSLLTLWAYASKFKSDGILDGMSKEYIEVISEWEGEDNKLIDTLIDIHFIDIVNETFQIHDWVENNPWSADSENRADKSRMSAIARKYPDIFDLLQDAGIKSIDKKNYEIINTASDKIAAVNEYIELQSNSKLTSSQVQVNCSLTSSNAPAPAPAPSPSPLIKEEKVKIYQITPPPSDLPSVSAQSPSVPTQTQDDSSARGASAAIDKNSSLSNSGKQEASSQKPTSQKQPKQQKQIKPSIGLPKIDITETDTQANAPLDEAHTVPPTLEMVRAYGKEIHSVVNPDEFFTQYEGTNWYANGSRIYNWHALYNAWQKREETKAWRYPFEDPDDEELRQIIMGHIRQRRWADINSMCEGNPDYERIYNHYFRAWVERQEEEELKELERISREQDEQEEENFED